jgi:hypothetical protein
MKMSSPHLKIALLLMLGLCILAYVLDIPPNGSAEDIDSKVGVSLTSSLEEENEINETLDIPTNGSVEDVIPKGGVSLNSSMEEENEINETLDILTNGSAEDIISKGGFPLNSSMEEENEINEMLDIPANGSAEDIITKGGFSLTSSMEEENEIIDFIRQKLKPHEFQFVDESLATKQILHLHTMKTGGTSVDNLLQCALRRLKDNLKVPYYEIHECDRDMFASCIRNKNDPCRGKMNNSAVMSFCSSLMMLDLFGWNTTDVAAFTELRHPVDRVWSMYRFQTYSCYHCNNLTDVYEAIENGEANFLDSLCVSELYNKQVEHLLSSDFQDDDPADEILMEAIYNMKSFFTVIGITEELQKTASVLGKVFPWMAPKIAGQSQTCRIGQDNASPKNNKCGPNKSHWKLPPHPDEATRKVIEKHNKLDIKLYEAAVQYFELQWRALEMGDYN